MIRKATVWGYHAPAPRNRVSVYPLSATAGQKPATAHRNAVLDPKGPPGRIRRMKNRDVSHAPTTLRGFTLVELMVTVAIVAILMAVGAPQLRGFLQKQQVNADADSLSAAVHLARSEALKRSGRVSVCPLANANTNPPACVATATTSWSQGWMVYIDYGVAGYQSNTDTILKVEQSIKSNSVTSSRADTDINFEANGLSSLNSAATLTIRSGDVGSTAPCKQLAISGQGRVTTSGC